MGHRTEHSYTSVKEIGWEGAVRIHRTQDRDKQQQVVKMSAKLGFCNVRRISLLAEEAGIDLSNMTVICGDGYLSVILRNLGICLPID